MKKLLKKLKPFSNSFLKPFLMGVLGALVVVLINNHIEGTDNKRIYDFYHTEMAATLSPNTLKKWVDNGDASYILVDLRSKGEYEKEHFKDAVNIPAGSLTEDELVSEFNKLDSSKEIVIHCYSHACTLGAKVGKVLSNHGIYVKELRVGWSELRYNWSIWNGGAKDTDNKDYIEVNPNVTSMPAPCTEGEFGC